MLRLQFLPILLCSLACVGDPPVPSVSPIKDAAASDTSFADADADLNGFSELLIENTKDCSSILGTNGSRVFQPLINWKNEGKPLPLTCDFSKDQLGLTCVLGALSTDTYQTYQTDGTIARPPGTQLVYTFDLRTVFPNGSVLAKERPLVLAQFAWGGRDQARVQLVFDSATQNSAQLTLATGSDSKTIGKSVSFDVARPHRIKVILSETEARVILDANAPLVLNVSKVLPSTFVFLAQLGPFFPAGSPDTGVAVTYHRFLAEACSD
jgi:hypothetical protein